MSVAKGIAALIFGLAGAWPAAAQQGLVLFSSDGAVEFSIDVDGADSDTCGTVAAPCATMAHVLGRAQDGDTIRFGIGRFVLQDVSIERSVNLVGAGRDETILDGGHKSRVLTTKRNARVMLKDLTIANGLMRGTSVENRAEDPKDVRGGGVRAYGPLIVENVAFRGNRIIGAAGHNGTNGKNGVRGPDGADGNNKDCRDLEGRKFDDCHREVLGKTGTGGGHGSKGGHATKGGGGWGGGLFSSGDLTMRNVLFDGNEAIGGAGGKGGKGGNGGNGGNGGKSGYLNFGWPKMCWDRPGANGGRGGNAGNGGNGARGGSGVGAGFFAYADNDTTVSISNVVFTGNHARRGQWGKAGHAGTGGTGGDGGRGGRSGDWCVKASNNDRGWGIGGLAGSNGEHGAVGNWGYSFGGAFQINGGGKPSEISNIVAVGNSANIGGAIAAFDAIALRHATLVRNHATWKGGAVYSGNMEPRSLLIANSLIHANTAEHANATGTPDIPLGGDLQILLNPWKDNPPEPVILGSCVDGFGGDAAMKRGNLDGCVPGLTVPNAPTEDGSWRLVLAALTPGLGSPLIDAGLPEEAGRDVAGIGGKGPDVALGVDAAGNQRIFSYPFRVDGMSDRTGVDRPDIGAYEALVGVESWPIGSPIAPPEAATGPDGRPFGRPRIEPSAAADRYFWDQISDQLIPLAEYQDGPVNLVWPTSAAGEDAAQPAFMHGRSDWPETPQIVAAGADFNLTTGADEALRFLAIGDPRSPGAVFDPAMAGLPEGARRLVTLLPRGAADVTKASPVFFTVEAVAAETFASEGPDCTVGVPLTDAEHDDPAGGNGFVADPRAMVDMGAPTSAYRRSTRGGPIVPVNASDARPNGALVVAWYKLGAYGIHWPDRASRHICSWPADAPVAEAGPGAAPLTIDGASATVWSQGDTDAAGYNPNDEHAWISDGDDVRALHILRWEATRRPGGAGRHVLVRSAAPESTADAPVWAYRTFRVSPGGSDARRMGATVGLPLNRPTPLDRMPGQACWQSEAEGPVHTDRTGILWPEAATGETPIRVRWWYPMQVGFAADLDGDGKDDLDALGCAPWLEGLGAAPGQPVETAYDAVWPTSDDLLTELRVGQSLPVGGSARLVHGSGISARLLDLSAAFSAPLDALPGGIETDRQGLLRGLPGTLADRLSWDRNAKRLTLSGGIDQGRPIPIHVNRISAADISAVKNMLSVRGIEDAGLIAALRDLARQSNAPARLEQTAVRGTTLLSTGALSAEGYVSVILNDGEGDNSAVSMRVARVSCPVFAGTVRVQDSGRIFDPTTDFIYDADFGGEADRVAFDWRFSSLPPGGVSDKVDTGTINGWRQFPESVDLAQSVPSDSPAYGLGSVRLDANARQVLEDTAVVVQTRGFEDVCGSAPTPWTGNTVDAGDGPRPAVMVGWARQVIGRFNAYDPRQQDLSQAGETTALSLIQLAGPRYENDVSFDEGEGLADRGLIQTYTTLLRRVRALTFAGGAESTPGLNDQMLDVAARISDLYRALGDEAVADFADPSVAVTDEDVGTQIMRTTSRFVFERQVPGSTRLEEELALLRGRDDSVDPVEIAPQYNRLRWVSGTEAEDEALYNRTYGIVRIADLGGGGGEDPEVMARRLFPQGHGDAWGHYLSAVKPFYELLRQPGFDWRVAANIANSVDGRSYWASSSEEAIFARAALEKAVTGVRITELTFRKSYRDRQIDRLLGHPGGAAEPGEIWSLPNWSRRIGQGVWLDWLALNAVLPAPVCGEDCTPDPKRVDRETMSDVAALPLEFQRVQLIADRAAAGLTPLGLPQGVVPFALDTDEKGFGEKLGHFEQVLKRSEVQLRRASNALESVEFFGRNLRRSTQRLSERQIEISAREAAARSALIRIYGQPYPGDVGGHAGTYPTGYKGPDLYNYDIVDFDLETLFGEGFAIEHAVGLEVPALDGLTQMFLDPTTTIVETAATPKPAVVPLEGFAKLRADANTIRDSAIDWLAGNDPMTSADPRSTTGFDLNPIKMKEFEDQAAKLEGGRKLRFVYAPELGTVLKPNRFGDQRRPETGELQYARLSFLREYGQLRQSIQEYDDLKLSLIEQLQRVKARVEGQLGEKQVQEDTLAEVTALQDRMLGAETVQIGAETTAQILSETAQAMMNANPLGLAAKGFTAASFVSRGIAASAQIRRNRLQVDRERVELGSQLELLAGKMRRVELLQESSQLLETAQRERALRMSLAQQNLAVHEAELRYLSLLAEGEREMDALVRFRRETASQTTTARYGDALNRMLRREAIAAYRALFDRAARHVYLAAKAYEYETGGYGYSRGFDRVLSRILQERSIGALAPDGELTTGQDNGLVGILGELRDRFEVFRINADVVNANAHPPLRLSLRDGFFRFPGVQLTLEQQSELAELLKAAEGDKDVEEILRNDFHNALLEPQSNAYWQSVLEGARVADLRRLPALRECCISASDRATGPMPGLVFEFETRIGRGLNLFGRPRTGRDAVAPNNAFATRIEGTAVVLRGFDPSISGERPQVFLIPAGDDTVPVFRSAKIRTWRVVDVKLPVLDDTGGRYGVDIARATARSVSSITAFHEESLVNGQPERYDTRLFGRDVQNSRWLLVIPGDPIAVRGNADAGIDALLGAEGSALTDVELWLKVYSYAEP